MWDRKFESTIREFLPLLSIDENVVADMKLRDAGLDSVGVVELLARLEELYGVRFQGEDLSLETFETPSTLWKRLSSRLV